MFEELFQRFPGLENLYENAVANGYTGDPQQLLKEYGQDFQQNIGGLGSVLGVTPQVMPQATMPQVMPQAMPATGQITNLEAQRIDAAMRQQAMSQPTMPIPSSMVDPTVMAYQRGLLSGTVQPQNPYGFGLATSPYYGYPRNPYGSLLY